MHEITILSGKGGTGKTSITAALAALADATVICDNDVDAADLFLLLQPTVLEQGIFTSGWTAHINNAACSQCGLCLEHCRFKAIELKNGRYHINPFSCEGCRLCERLCPEQAITSTPNSGNQWFLSDTANGAFVHAQMGPSEENSGKLVSFIRRKAAQEAEQELKTANIPLLAKIPFSQVMREAILAQKNIVDYAPQSEAAEQIRHTWNYLAGRE